MTAASSGRRLAERLGPLGFLLSLLLVWEALSQAQWISPLFFPSPLRTFEALFTGLVDGGLYPALGATLLRMLYGWLLASLMGVLLGAVIAASRTGRALFEPTLEFLRPMPASAMIPLAILAFGLSDTMSTAVIAFGSLWPVLMASVQGFGALEPRLHEVSRALEMSRTRHFAWIALPAAMPGILAGARVGLAIALILAVVTEMQASLPGIGQELLLAQRAYRSPDLYAGVLLLGLIGYAASALLARLEYRLLRWQH